ncbi:MAG TPA: zinc metalloprotease HtpX [Polyangiaceae bacterium]|nr:zinc metalloprotease HtpX [Polyangiaceae bacterium]
MKNQIKTIVLLGALSALVVGAGRALAPSLTYVFAAIAVLMNLCAYFFSDRVVLAMHRAREVSPSEAPELHEMVDELAARARIPKPRLFVIAEEQPNAFATGRNPKHGVVAVTEGIVRILSPRELRAVLAHEIAHIKNRDILLSSIAAAAASLLSFVANASLFSGLFGGSSDEEREGGGGGILLALVAPIAATLIQLGISRSREYLADETGAELCGDPRALASALGKLERGAELIPQHAPQPATASLFIMNPLSGQRGLLEFFSTHPRVEERVRRLEQLARRSTNTTDGSAGFFPGLEA